MTIDTNPNSPTYGQYVGGPQQGMSAPVIGGQLYQGPVEQAPQAIQAGMEQGRTLGAPMQGNYVGYQGNTYSPNAWNSAVQQRQVPGIQAPNVGEGYDSFNPEAKLDPNQIIDQRNKPWYETYNPQQQYRGNDILPPGMGMPPNVPDGTWNPIFPPNVGNAGLQAPNQMGPNGRTFDQITGNDYLSPEERIWYLNQIGMTVDASGAVVPYNNTITPPNLPGAGLQGQSGFAGQGTAQQGGAAGGGVGPAGRTFQQITGTAYLSPEEREWYLGQMGKQVTGSGAVVGGNTSGQANWSAWGELPGGQVAGWAQSHGYDPSIIIYGGQNQFSPEVEQWRPLVAQYFRPEDVNHALWLIQRESGGKNVTQIGGGPGTGLFQVEHGGYWPGRPSQQELLDPATNIAYAASMVYG